MKLYICGWKLSGKDHASEYLKKKLGITFESSSMFCIREVLFERLQAEFGFQTPEEAFEARRTMPGLRQWLFEAISDYNTPDPTALSEAIFSKYDLYTGIRSEVELKAAKKRWSDAFVIWIDAEGRVPPEDISSCTVTKELADIVIENKGSLEEFEDKLNRFCYFLKDFCLG